MQIHPQYISRGGKDEFVVLPYEEFVALQELLADAEDVLDLREAKRKEGDRPAIPIDEVKARFGVDD